MYLCVSNRFMCDHVSIYVFDLAPLIGRVVPLFCHGPVGFHAGAIAMSRADYINVPLGFECWFSSIHLGRAAAVLVAAFAPFPCHGTSVVAPTFPICFVSFLKLSVCVMWSLCFVFARWDCSIRTRVHIDSRETQPTNTHTPHRRHRSPCALFLWASRGRDLCVDR